MTKFSSRQNYPFDAEPSATLRALGSGAVTATGTESPISLDASGLAYWQDDGMTFEHMAVVVDVTSIDTANGDETYQFEVEVADDQAFTTNVVSVGTLAGVNATGVYVIVLSRDNLNQLAKTAKYMRMKHTLGGTTPSADYTAWVAQVVGAH